jgi:hypothetical protein
VKVKDAFDFLMACLDKFGPPASILFRNFDLSKLDFEQFQALDSREDFVWCFISESVRTNFEGLFSQVNRLCQQNEIVERGMKAELSRLIACSKAREEEHAVELKTLRESFEEEKKAMKETFELWKSEIEIVKRGMKAEISRLIACSKAREEEHAMELKTLRESFKEEMKETFELWKSEIEIVKREMKAEVSRLIACNRAREEEHAVELKTLRESFKEEKKTMKGTFELWKTAIEERVSQMLAQNESKEEERAMKIKRIAEEGEKTKNESRDYMVKINEWAKVQYERFSAWMGRVVQSMKAETSQRSVEMAKENEKANTEMSARARFHVSAPMIKRRSEVYWRWSSFSTLELFVVCSVDL